MQKAGLVHLIVVAAPAAVPLRVLHHIIKIANNFLLNLFIFGLFRRAVLVSSNLKSMTMFHAIVNLHVVRDQSCPLDNHSCFPGLLSVVAAQKNFHQPQIVGLWCAGLTAFTPFPAFAERIRQGPEAVDLVQCMAFALEKCFAGATPIVA